MDRDDLFLELNTLLSKGRYGVGKNNLMNPSNPNGRYHEFAKMNKAQLAKELKRYKSLEKIGEDSKKAQYDKMKSYEGKLANENPIEGPHIIKEVGYKNSYDSDVRFVPGSKYKWDATNNILLVVPPELWEEYYEATGQS
jgi:hypothetical protein